MQKMDEESLGYGSGCESGWTMYLDQSFEKPNLVCPKQVGFSCKNGGHGEEDEYEEDLSMVSDASSGPPLFHEDDDQCDENLCFCSATSSALANKTDKRRRGSQRQKQEKQHSSLMDDTASSHVSTYSKTISTLTNKKASREDMLEFSAGFSATHFNGKSGLQNHYSLLQTALPGKTASPEPICMEETRNKTW